MDRIDEIKNYWNLRSKGFSFKTNDELKTDFDKWNNKIETLLADISGKNALDIGCGPGFFTIILSRQGYNVTAFDYSDKMLDEAKINVKNSGLSAKFVQGDAQKLPFDDETFNVIVSRNLMWNLEKPQEAYKEWLRVLKLGGCIINCDGNHYSHHYRDEYMLERKQPSFTDGHNLEYMKDIDVTVMDEIAKELPLSKEMRPKWDIDFLIDNGVCSIGAEIARNSFKDDNNKNHSIIKSFILKAVKSI